MNFSATIEYVSATRAIVCMTDAAGAWSGASRVEIRSRRRGDLYEAGYRVAAFNAAAKGGRLETFREITAP